MDASIATPPPQASNGDVAEGVVGEDARMGDGWIDDRGPYDLEDSPLRQWYNQLGPDSTTAEASASANVDADMSSLDEIDRKILASLILNVDITEVYSPIRINRLARRFGL